MTTLRTPPPPRPSPTRTPTMADLLERLGNIPPGRVLFQPKPGLAAVEDVASEITRLEELRGVRTGVSITGPSPGANRNGTPMTSRGNSRSAKIIAASTPRISAASIVTCAASAGDLQISTIEWCLRTARYSAM